MGEVLSLRHSVLLLGLLAGAGLAAQSAPEEPPPPPPDQVETALQADADAHWDEAPPPHPVADPVAGATPGPEIAAEKLPDTGEEPLPPHLSLREYPWVEGNRADLLVDGTQAFPAIFAAAQSAQRTLLVECYIFGDDAVGHRMIEIMTDRAKAGVKVKLILDGLGSEDLPLSALTGFTAAGGEYHIYNPVNAVKRLLNHSHDHRKIIVVDGRRGFLGGLNLTSVEETWHDFMIEIEGPGVASLTRLFAGLWEKLDGSPLAGADYFPEPVPAGALRVRVLGNQARRMRWEIYASYRDALRRARHEVIIANSYFIPDPKIRRELYRAVKRGVRVILLLPGRSDVPVTLAASEYLYRKLLLSGVEIYHYKPQNETDFLHAKVAVIDGRWLTVGSYNFDHQSLFNNLEVTAVIEDAELGAQLRHTLLRDIYRALPALTLENWEPRPWLKKLKSRWWYTWRKFM